MSILSHPAEFLHDDSCPVCVAHRWVVEDVRLSMLGDLQDAIEDAGGAASRSPAGEWERLLGQVRTGARLEPGDPGRIKDGAKR